MIYDNTYDNTRDIPKRTLVFFLMVDTSGSQGEAAKIEFLNEAVKELHYGLWEIAGQSPDMQIKVAAMAFSQEVRWQESRSVNVEEFYWNLPKMDGRPNLGAAFEALNEKLSRKAYMNEPWGCYVPVILLVSDGVSGDDYTGGLEKLKENKWFQAGVKLAAGISKNADREMLAGFTGNQEAVFTLDDSGVVRDMIHLMGKMIILKD